MNRAWAMSEAEWSRAFAALHAEMRIEAQWGVYFDMQYTSDAILKRDGKLKDQSRINAWKALDAERAEFSVLTAQSGIMRHPPDAARDDLTATAYAGAASTIDIIREQRVALTERILKDVLNVDRWVESDRRLWQP